MSGQLKPQDSSKHCIYTLISYSDHYAEICSGFTKEAEFCARLLVTKTLTSVAGKLKRAKNIVQ